MRKGEEFQDYVVHDLLGGIPGVTSRAMFGGYGIYKDGKIFSIIVDSELYFKATDAVKEVFKKSGSRPFTYTKKNGKTYTMKYYSVPEKVMENRETLDAWVDLALSSDGVKE